jgi:hypothetical protein
MPNDLLQQNIAPILGIDKLPEDEQAVFLMDIGDLIVESALLRLVVDLDENQEAALNQYLETEPQPEVLMEYLLSHHKNFSQILEEEIVAFKEEAIQIFGTEKTATVA